MSCQAGAAQFAPLSSSGRAVAGVCGPPQAMACAVSGSGSASPTVYEQAISGRIQVGVAAADALSAAGSRLHSRKLKASDEPPFR